MDKHQGEKLRISDTTLFSHFEVCEDLSLNIRSVAQFPKFTPWLWCVHKNFSSKNWNIPGSVEKQAAGLESNIEEKANKNKAIKLENIAIPV